MKEENRNILTFSFFKTWPERFILIKGVLYLTLLVQILLSYSLWKSQREFFKIPLLPFSFFPASWEMDEILIWATMLTLPFTLFITSLRRFLPITLIPALILGLEDQNRWQPWFFQYLVMWPLFLTDEKVNKESILWSLRLLLIGIYFWSGLHKVNLSYWNEVGPWLFSPLEKWFGGSLSFMTRPLIYFSPFFEILLAIFLFPIRTRKYAIIGVLIIHISILSLISPWGHNWNKVVWPWNLLMMLLVLIVFLPVTNSSKELTTKRDWHEIFKTPSIRWIALWFWLLPPLAFFNLFDSYPSFALYSGTRTKAHFFLTYELQSQLPGQALVHVKHSIESEYGDLDIFAWSLHDLNVPIYPESRIYLSIFKQICKNANFPNEGILIIKNRPRPWTQERRSKKFYCETF